MAECTYLQRCRDHRKKHGLDCSGYGDCATCAGESTCPLNVKNEEKLHG